MVVQKLELILGSRSDVDALRDLLLTILPGMGAERAPDKGMTCNVRKIDGWTYRFVNPRGEIVFQYDFELADDVYKASLQGSVQGNFPQQNYDAVIKTAEARFPRLFAGAYR